MYNTEINTKTVIKIFAIVRAAIWQCDLVGAATKLQKTPFLSFSTMNIYKYVKRFCNIHLTNIYNCVKFYNIYIIVGANQMGDIDITKSTSLNMTSFNKMCHMD